MKPTDIEIGKTYNSIKILADLGIVKHHHRYACKCTLCGKEYTIDSKFIGITKSCRDCFGLSHRNDISGKRFGRLVAIRLDRIENKYTYWLCRCDCGKEVVVRYSHLFNGCKKSCGCLSDENRHIAYTRKCANRNFGNVSTHPLYSVWTNILTRCYNQNSSAYLDYGGRGIVMCDRWLPQNRGFENFVNDMGERPTPKHTIDRINVNGNYEPSNCRWITMKEQQNNKRSNVNIIVNSESISLTVFCERYGFNYDFCKYHVRCGVDINIVAKYCVLKQRGQIGRVPDLVEFRNMNKVVSQETLKILQQIA